MKITPVFSTKEISNLLPILKLVENIPSIILLYGRKIFCNTICNLLLTLLSILFFSKEANANFTVPSGTIVRADTLAAYGGVLIINGTLNLARNTTLPGFTSVIINGPNGQIYWTNNSDLTFATGTTIVIKDSAAGLRPGGGNSSQRLWVGTTLIAVANNNSGPAALTFTDMNNAGGLPQFTLAVSATSICYGNTISATLMPLNTTLSYDCRWSVNNSGIISPAAATNFNSAKTATITPVSNAITKLYTISCSVYKTGDNDPITTKTFNVTVNPVPSIPTLVSATPATICLGYTSNFTATSTGNVIEWFTVASGGTSIGTSASGVDFTINPIAATDYYAGTLISSTGCTSALRSAASLTVNQLPAAPNTVTVTPAAVCAGSSLNIAAVSSGNTIEWYSGSEGGTTLGTSTSGSDFTINPSINTTYYAASLASATGCRSSFRAAVTAIVNPLPATPVNVIATPASICVGSSLNLIATSAGAAIEWYAGVLGGTSNSTNESEGNYVISPVASNNYYAGSLISATGCRSASRAAVTVVVNPLPDAPASVVAIPAIICIGSAANLNAMSYGNTVEWYNEPLDVISIGSAASTVNFTVSPFSTNNYYAGSLTNSTGCRSASRIPVVVTVSPLSVGGNMIGNANICSGVNNTILTLNDFIGSITRWESSTDNFATANTIDNYSATFTAANVSVKTYYRAVVTNSVCNSANSNSAVLTVSNNGNWLGVNTDWNSTLNWCNGILPTSTENIIIDNGLSNYPIINGPVSVNSLTIAAGGLVSLTSTGILKVAGNINSKIGIKATTGVVELNGAQPQTISATYFVNNTIANLTVSNMAAGASATNPSVAILATGGILKVSGAVSFGNVNNALLQTNDNLTLLSTAVNTARIADVTNNNINSNNTIEGKVVIERYIAARRAWRFLTAPVTAASNVTINESWQEAAVVTDPAANTAGTNPAPGYGTHISLGYPVASPGYDLNINGNSSIKYYTSTGLNGIPATTNTGSITDQPGYLLFVRGNRSTQLSLGTASPLTSTILRVKGFINTGLKNIILNPGFKNSSTNFRVVSNPYPSSIDFHKMMQNSTNVAGGFADAFYMWDANLGGLNGTGGWVALSYNNLTGMYDRNIASNVDNSGAIQSGSAILINYNGVAGNIVVRESDKLANSNISMLRPVRSFNTIRTSLLGINTDSSTELIDAAMISFDKNNSNEIDNWDMKKLDNFEESFSFMTKGNLLAIERRKPVAQADTILYNLTKMKQKNYQLKFETDSIDLPKGTVIYLEDLFLNNKFPVSINTTIIYNFKISADVLSANPNRFQLIFITSIDTAASKKNVLNNSSIANVKGDRIKNINEKQGMFIFPNPAISNTIDLQMNEISTGFYTVRLYNNAGEILTTKIINYAGGKSTQLISAFQNLLNGSYQLQIISPDKKLITLKVIVQKK